MNKTQDQQEREHWEHLQNLVKDPSAQAMLRALLNDMRLKYELVSPQTVINADGSLNVGLSMRKSVAYELHQMYSQLLPEGAACGYDDIF